MWGCGGTGGYERCWGADVGVRGTLGKVTSFGRELIHFAAALMYCAFIVMHMRGYRVQGTGYREYVFGGTKVELLANTIAEL